MPSDNDEHVVLANTVWRHADHLNGFTLFEGRDHLRSPAFRLERETDFIFQVVIPTQGLFVGPGIDDPTAITAGPATITPPSSAPPKYVTYTEYDTDGNEIYQTTGDYAPGFKIAHQIKDLRLALEAAEAVGIARSASA